MEELVALIPENRRKFLAFLCENNAPHSLSQISHSLRLVHLTTRKIAYEFEALCGRENWNIFERKNRKRVE